MAPSAPGDGSSAEAVGEHERTKWRPAFEAALKAIMRDYQGQEEKVREGMAHGMRRLFEHPYEVELGRLRAKRLGKPEEPLTIEDAQRVIFFPTLSDMQYYAEALALDTPEATKRREKLMKIKMVSVFYTLHRRDGALVDRFMHCGGLQSLAELVGDENPVVQSEAVELLMEMLSPHMQLGAISSSPRQAHLHHKIWECLRSSSFWRNFAEIVGEPAERFPNSHEHSIRIIAGAVGWLRPDEGSMPGAAAPPDVSAAAEALQAHLERGGGMRPDIRGVAEDLVAELNDAPVVRGDPLPEGAERREALEMLLDAEAVQREDKAHAWQALKQLGTEAFKAGLVWPAEAAYSLALSEGGKVVPPMEAGAIQANRALVLLKAGQPLDAAEAAKRALDHDPRNAKAAFRRAQGLLEFLDASRSAPAAAADSAAPAAASALAAAAAARAGKRRASEAVEAAELAASLEPKDAKVAEMLRRAKAKFEELSMAAEAAEAAAAAAAASASGAAGGGAAASGGGGGAAPEAAAAATLEEMD